MIRIAFALALGLSLAAAAPAQFIHDIDVPGGRRPSVPGMRPPRLAPIAVEKHVVRVVFADGVATTTVRQVFRNPNGMQLEGTYLFPLPEDAALSGFAMLMGGKMTPGEVLEKEKAAAIYRDIVARAMDPALLEYVGRRLFQAKVFPIPAQGTAEIELTYSETLARSGGMIEYRYPLRTSGASPYPVNELSIVVEAESKTPMRAVYSPSHPVDVVKKGDFAFKASFEQKPCVADRDFALVVGLGSDPVGATLMTHVEEGGDGAFVLLLSPSESAAASDVVAKDVVFVADTSGSMAGEKLEQLKRSLAFCVKSLEPSDRFNVVSFSTEARSWREGLSAADKDSKEAALKFVGDLRALGGTNISDALATSLATPKDASRPFMVIFLTDGMPTVGLTDVESILKEAAKSAGAATRLFVFGIGHDVNTALLDRLADENRGARDYVGDREDLELKLSGFFQKVSSPVLADVKLTVDGVKIDETYPKRLPDLFRGSQLLVTGRYKGAGGAKVKIEGQINGKPVTYDYALTFGTGGKDPAIPRLWAVRKVGYLLDQVRLNGADKELKDEIVRLGVKYGIVTPYTSYLVTEDAPLATRLGAPGAIGGGRPGGNADAPRRRAGSSADPSAPAPSSGAPLDALESKAEEANDADAPEATKFARAERRKDAEKARAGFTDDPVALSLSLKKLRESEGQDDALSGMTIRRVGDRTFYFRDGLFIESTALKLDAEALKGATRIVAFTDEYFALLTKRPHLAVVLALGDVLFKDGETTYLVSIKAPESRP